MTNPNDPAFSPDAYYLDSEAAKEMLSRPKVCYGLSKREYFAGQILAGLRANKYNAGNASEGLAQVAVMDADALIFELNKEKS